MAATISNPAKLIALNSNEDAALAALLYELRDPELLRQIVRDMGVTLGANQQAEIAELWGKLYAAGSVKV